MYQYHTYENIVRVQKREIERDIDRESEPWIVYQAAAASPPSPSSSSTHLSAMHDCFIQVQHFGITYIRVHRKWTKFPNAHTHIHKQATYVICKPIDAQLRVLKSI